MILSSDTLSNPAASWHSNMTHRHHRLMPMFSRPALKIKFETNFFFFCKLIWMESLVVLGTASQIAHNPSRVMSSGVYFSVLSTGHHEAINANVQEGTFSLWSPEIRTGVFNLHTDSLCRTSHLYIVGCWGPSLTPTQDMEVATPSLPPIPSKLWQLNVSRCSQMFLGEQNYFPCPSTPHWETLFWTLHSSNLI